MKLRGLSIQGLRSFVGDHVFHFPEGGGTYFVGGDNQAEPELGPNGCGKSAIWDVLCWVIYGRSTRGQIARDVANWTREYASIGALDFEIRGVHYSITRTWDPNSLTLQRENESPRVVEQSDIIELIGLSYELFLATVVMSQFGTPFLELGKVKKLEWFSTVLGLDVWTEKADQAKADASAHKLSAADKKSCVRELNVRISSLKKAESAEDQRSYSWLAAHTAATVSARDYVFRAEQAQQVATEALLDLRTRRAEDLDELRELQQRQDADGTRLHAVTLVIHSTNQEITELGLEIDDIKRALESLRCMEGTCTTCLQVVGEQQVARVEGILTGEISEVERRTHIAVAERDRNYALECQGNTVYAEHAAGLSARRKSLESLDDHLERATRAEVGTSRDLADAIARVSKLENEESPHEDALAGFAHDIDECSRQWITCTKDYDTEEAARVEAEALSAYFRDTRLWICESAMDEFAAEMSSVLEQLGLVGWEVSCDLEKPTRSGKSTSRGFQVLIRSPKSPDWVPWESWCGGETQRLSLAGSVAFSDLACSRLGISTNVEVWDEPTQHLSPQGVEDLLSYLHTRARRLQRQVFLVDHRSIDAGQFSGTYTVVMDGSGSRIESDIVRRGIRCDRVMNRASGRRRFSELQASATG